MKLHNTLTRTTENFTPSQKNTVSVYSCGPTVYDYLHIGNWATYIRWDVLIRTLRSNGWDVNWVMNITDVGHLTSDADEGEDKLEKGAQREGKTAWQVADYYTQDFLRGLKLLNINLGENGRLPKATDHITEQINLAKQLDEKGFLYKIDGDGMYFDTQLFQVYGKLARLDTDGLKAGARVDADKKRNPTDFAVWKFSPTDKKRDMEWDSPWGIGFPGWHLECSAMAMKYLGETLDIHTGGIDHIPVHHTNEIAQSEAATGKQFARFWLHSNFLLVDDQKIAKSLGNGITLKDITSKGYSGQDLRMLVLQSHYRSQASFNWDILESAKARLKNWQTAASLRWQPSDLDTKSNDLNKHIEQAIAQLQDVLNDDLNTPQALSVLDAIFDQVLAAQLETTSLQAFNKLLEAVNQLLGINLFDEDISDAQKQLLAKRAKAREANDWSSADLIRDELASLKIGVRDTKHGQRWFRL